MSEAHYVLDILILLAAAVVTVPLFQRLGLGSVLGYLAAGVIVGPWGFGFIDRIEDIRTIAEFGVVFLLFSIGIELKPARLWALRRMVVGLGCAQVLITGLVIAGLSLLLVESLKVALIIGFGLALSSTAFVLQLLAERGEIGTHHGRTAFSVLLLQDLAVVPLLMVVSLLAVQTSPQQDLGFAMMNAVLVIAFVILFGRYLLSPALRLVASSRTTEVFTAAAVLAVLGTAWLMEEVGLSMALGAFLAGVMLAESHYRHQVIADIQPFRGMLLGLFFMGVGMSIDFGLLGKQGALIAGLVLGLLVIKAVILWALCRLMGVVRMDATRVSLLLSQSGEFGFVLFGLAAINGVLPVELFNILILLVALTMMTTPLMANLGEYLSSRLSGAAGSHDVSTEHLDAELPHVIIAGFGRVGRRIVRILQAANVPYLVIERNADTVLEGRREGFSVFYGDAGRVDVLKAAGVGQASVLVCTLDQVEPAVRLVNTLREHYPGITIHARGRDRQHCDQLLAAGASKAISESLEASLQIGGAALRAVGVLERDTVAVIAKFRKDYYG
ncbi:MAG: monovalent cation:proton antiporter-2 (CPA2) family protein [Halieaceae bacterium]